MKLRNEVAREHYSLLEFCDAFRISRDMYYKLKKQGKAPNIIKIGRRVVIPVEDAEKWKRQMKASTPRT